MADNGLRGGRKQDRSTGASGGIAQRLAAELLGGHIKLVELLDPVKCTRAVLHVLYPGARCPQCGAAFEGPVLDRLDDPTCSCGNKLLATLHSRSLAAPTLVALSILLSLGLEDGPLAQAMGARECDVRLWKQGLSSDGLKSKEELKAAHLLDNVRKVFLFLRAAGWKVSQAQVYQDVKEGKLFKAWPSAYFSEAGAFSYARSHLRYRPGCYDDDGSGTILRTVKEIRSFLAQNRYAASRSSLYDYIREGRLGNRRDGFVSKVELLTFAERCLKKLPAITSGELLEQGPTP